MFLKERKSGELVEVLDTQALFDPFKTKIQGRYNAGEELPEPQTFVKDELEFLSGESLPRCWVDAHYRDHEIGRSGTNG